MEIGLQLLTSLESRITFLIRGRTIYVLKSEGIKPFSRDKFIMVVMVGRRTSTQFFRSQVGSRSRIQDLGFAGRMIFFKSSSEIRSKSVKKLLQDS